MTEMDMAYKISTEINLQASGTEPIFILTTKINEMYNKMKSILEIASERERSAMSSNPSKSELLNVIF